MNTLSIRLLGPPVIQLNDQDISADLPQKAQALLFYLVMVWKLPVKKMIQLMKFQYHPETARIPNMRETRPIRRPLKAP